jgi:hypothetical protein
MPRTRSGCSPGVQFHPAAPFADAGAFWFGTTLATGTFASTTGAVSANSSVLVGGGNSGAWVRADNRPPFGAGWTIVSTQVSFSNFGVNLLLWVPAFSAGGSGLTIQLFDGGPSGPFLGSCRVPLLERSIPIGTWNEFSSRSVFHTCAIHHAAGTGFLSTKIVVDAYANHYAPWGGFASGFATGTVQSVQFNTCLD